jgi:glycosyltransferase involved in cell wall biosynthesis
MSVANPDCARNPAAHCHDKEDSRMSPLVSIIIPTKDRHATLLPVVAALLAQIVGKKYEIVVQDNSADNSAERMLSELPNARHVIYRHEPLPVSIVENTERAIRASRGTYLIFIGDDDLVSPYICEVADFMDSCGITCLTYPAAYYWWSSVNFVTPTPFHRAQALWLPKVRGLGLQKRIAKHVLDYTLANGAVSLFDLPRFYHGVVRRDVLDAIHARTGTYVAGASPDMAFSLALAMVVDEFWHVDFPVSVYGASRGSGGGRTAEKKHHGRIEEQRHLPLATIDGWDSRIPRVWSEQTIYSQTACEVLAAFGRPDTLRYEALYASMLVNERYLSSWFRPLMGRYCLEKPGNVFRLLRSVGRKVIGRTIRSIKARTGTMNFDVIGAEDVGAVMTLLSQQEFAPPTSDRTS